MGKAPVLLTPAVDKAASLLWSHHSVKAGRTRFWRNKTCRSMTKSRLAVGIGIRAVRAGDRVLFDAVIGWVSRLDEATTAE